MRRLPLGTRRGRSIAAAVAVAAVCVAFATMPLAEWVLVTVDWIGRAGVVGVAVYSTLYVLGTLAVMPGSLLTMTGGFAYGIAGGFIIAMIASLVGATLAFLLARSIGRSRVEHMVQRDVRLAAIDRMVEERGFRLMLLLRLSPIVPYSILNYSLGLTRVSLRDYMATAAVGMVPGTILYVYLGSLVTSASALLADEPTRAADAGLLGSVVYWGGFVVTLTATVWIAHASHRAVQAALDESPDDVPATP